MKREKLSKKQANLHLRNTEKLWIWKNQKIQACEVKDRAEKERTESSYQPHFSDYTSLYFGRKLTVLALV